MTALKRLPGVGRRAAERMALEFIHWQDDELLKLGELIASLPQKAGKCPVCGNISTGENLCAICSSAGRDTSTICLVEDFTRIAPVENSGMYRGLYHVLGGKLSPLDGMGAKELNVESLLKRLETDEVKELIIMLSGDVEGRATCNYICDRCADLKIKITIPARGLPAGADPAYADSATIAMALKARQNWEQ